MTGGPAAPTPARRALAERRAALDRADRAHAADLRRATGTLDTIGPVLERLAHPQDPHELERRFCRDVATSCDFARVMLSRVDGAHWRPWAVSWATDPEYDRHFATHLRGTRIPFADAPAEERAHRDRTPIVLEPGAAPAPLVGLARTYVVVPLTGSSGVFGLVHADHGRTTRRIEPIDPDALWLLADGFARRYERALLGERLRTQQALLRAALAELEAASASAAPIALHPGPSDPRSTAIRRPPPVTLLSARERDVADLLAKGCNNAVIARELIIVEGTVKTHVKNVMRKLGAGTRAEAIALIHGHHAAAR